MELMNALDELFTKYPGQELFSLQQMERVKAAYEALRHHIYRCFFAQHG